MISNTSFATFVTSSSSATAPLSGPKYLTVATSPPFVWMVNALPSPAHWTSKVISTERSPVSLEREAELLPTSTTVTVTDSVSVPPISGTDDKAKSKVGDLKSPPVKASEMLFESSVSVLVIDKIPS